MLISPKETLINSSFPRKRESSALLHMDPRFRENDESGLISASLSRHSREFASLTGMNPSAFPIGQAGQCFPLLCAHGDSIEFSLVAAVQLHRAGCPHPKSTRQFRPLPEGEVVNFGGTLSGQTAVPLSQGERLG